jgi:hypothetical protein
MSSTEHNGFNPLPMVLVVLVMLLLVSLRFQSHTLEVSIPRYCKNTAQTLQHLEAVITSDRPAGDEARRPYLIAAKLLYLFPQQADETSVKYLNRVELYLDRHCRSAG